jgi:hypothetical protein
MTRYFRADKDALTVFDSKGTVYTWIPENVSHFKPKSEKYYLEANGFESECGNGLFELSWLNQENDRNSWDVSFEVAKHGDGEGGSSYLTLVGLGNEEMGALMQALMQLVDSESV